MKKAISVIFILLFGLCIFYSQAPQAEAATAKLALPEVSATQTSTSITLKWKKVKNATGYRVYLYNTKTEKWRTIETVTAKKYKVADLKAGKKYTFAVKPYKELENGKRVWGKYTKITVATNPAKPKVKATSVGTKTVKLSWSKVTGATGYRVYKYNSKTEAWEKLKTTKATSCKVTGLKSGTKYTFAVRAYTKQKDAKTLWSYRSKIKVVTELPKASLNSRPKTVDSISLTLLDGNSVKLTWRKRNSNVTYYVSYCDYSSGFKMLTTTKKSSYTIKNLKANKLYKICICAFIEENGIRCWSEDNYVDIIIKNGKILRDEEAMVGHENIRPMFDWSVEDCCYICGREDCGPTMSNYYCVICKKQVYAHTCHPIDHFVASYK